jgi:NAD(P)H-dependent FMN reductase
VSSTVPTPRILAFGGSLRRASFNHGIVQIAADAAEAAGAEVTRIRLADYPMPIFDEDLEAASGLPEHAVRLKELFREHHGLLIGCPEYNGSITAALKNAIDWVTRPQEGHPPLDGFAGKYAGLVAASPGALGGIRGLVPVRSLLSGIQCTVIAAQAAVPKVHEVLDEDGSISDDRSRGMVEGVGRTLAETLAKLHA